MPMLLLLLPLLSLLVAVLLCYVLQALIKCSAALQRLNGWPPARRPRPRIGRQTCHDTVDGRTTSLHFGHRCPLPAL